MSGKLSPQVAWPLPPGPLWIPSQGAQDVLAERRRQIEKEGWSAEHDAAHPVGDFERAAATYALYTYGVPATAKVEGLEARYLWPWDWKWFKPKDRRRDLVRAAALLIAAIDKGDHEWAELDRKHKERLSAAPDVKGASHDT